MLRGYRDRAAQIDGQLSGHERRVRDDWVVVMNGEHHPVTVVSAEGGHDVQYNSHSYAVRSDWQFGQLWSLMEQRGGLNLPFLINPSICLTRSPVFSSSSSKFCSGRKP